MSNVIEVENQSAELVQREDVAAAQMLDLAVNYRIDCPEMAEAAADDLGQIKAKIKALDEQRLSMTRPLDEAKKRIMELFERPRSVLVRAEAALKASLLTWQDSERKRLEAERKAQEEALRKQQEAMRRQQEEAERKAKEAAASGDTTAAVEAEAQAQAIAATAEAVAHMAPAVTAAPAKIAGVSTREDWKCELVDLMTLVKAVAAGEASIELLEFNQKEANKRAKALKQEFKVPGLRAYAEQVMSARAKG